MTLSGTARRLMVIIDADSATTTSRCGDHQTGP